MAFRYLQVDGKLFPARDGDRGPLGRLEVRGRERFKRDSIISDYKPLSEGDPGSGSAELLARCGDPLKRIRARL